MNNSRSQTKIRKTQQVNLLAEQRYLKQKGLITENIHDFKDCFDKFDLSIGQIPQSCIAINTKDDFVSCTREINSALLKMNKRHEIQPLLDCLETEAQNSGIYIDITDPLELDTEDELEDKKIAAINFFTEDEDKELLKRLLSAETLDEFYEILKEEDQELPDDPDEEK